MTHNKKATFAPVSQEDVNTFVDAARRGDTATLATLLDICGTDIINALDNYHYSSALIVAVKYQQSKAIDFLLEQNADINGRDQHGETALMWAVWTGKKELVEKMLDQGAIVSIKNHAGNTALTLAELHNENIIAALIRQHEAKQTQRPPVKIRGPRLKPKTGKIDHRDV